MFTPTTFTRDTLINPTKLAYNTINAMSDSLDGDYAIGDMNNGFCVQMVAAVSIFSSIAKMIDTNYAYIYPKRARTSTHLYPHLSEFDYEKLTASPASLNFAFEMSKVWLQQNAVPFDANYNIFIIPKTTILTVGTITFSLHYPIIIYVNKNTGIITATYDVSETSPFESLESNMLLSPPVEYTKNGITYVAIGFQTHQFSRLSDTATMSATEGFKKTIPYTDQFYAVRVWSVATDGTKTELAYCYNALNYDVATPTVIITPQTDASSVTLQIPQIYFDNGLMPNKIAYTIYTTKGAMNYSIPIADAQNVRANFDVGSSKYAAPLSKMSIYKLYALDSVVVGGSDAMTFAQIKDAVVNQKLYDRIPITSPELAQAASKAGYSITRQTDDLTDRIFTATNTLLDDKGQIIPVITSTALLTSDSLGGDPSSILNHGDGSYTIHPTTLFYLQDSGDVVLPCTDAQVANLSSMTTDQIIIELNSGRYLRQPFHIVLNTKQISPYAKIYNLLSPVSKNLIFVKENIHSAPQMSVTAHGIIHLDNGTGGYVLRLAITQTADMISVDPSKLRILLMTTTKSDSTVYLEATYLQSTTTGVVFEALIGTTYAIDADGYISLLMTNSSGILSAVQVPLDALFDIRLMVESDVFPTIPQDVDITTGVPIDTSGLLGISRQTLAITFGSDMSSKIYTAVNTSWGNDVYKTYGTTVYETTDADIYQVDEKNRLVIRPSPTVAGRYDVVTLYKSGDTPSVTTMITTQVAEYASAATDTITVTDPTGLLIGMRLIYPGIPYDTTILSIAGSVIRFTSPLGIDLAENVSIGFSNGQVLVRTSFAMAEPSTIVPMTSVDGWYIGMSAMGLDIPDGTTVTDVDHINKTLTLTATVELDANTLLTGINKTAYGVVKHNATDIVSDATGTPILVKDRQNQYRIPMMLFDGRLYQSDDTTDQTTVAELPSKISAYADGMSAIRLDFGEQQDIYYRPSKTMGYATFGIGDNVTKTMSLALSLTIRVSVPQSVYEDANAQADITSTILNICTAQIQQDVISSTSISNAIEDALSNTITGIAVGGINNNDLMMIVALRDTDCVPSLEGVLSKKLDGSITRQPNVNITYIASPDGS